MITLAGGGNPGKDNVIRVEGDGPGGSLLFGQASLITDQGRPHPGLPRQDGRSLCTTTPAV